MKYKKEIVFIGLVLVFFLFVFIYPEYTKNSPPELVIFQAKNPSGEVELNASCYAKISNNKEVYSKEMELIEDISDYVNIETFFIEKEGGRHKLETELSKKDRFFEIEIICRNLNNTWESNIKLNKERIPCLRVGDTAFC